MKQTVTKTMFIDAFVRCGRKDQFSYDALCALFDYYEDLEEDTGEEIELDPIAICCEWSEGHWEDIAMNYDVDIEHCYDNDERIGEVESYLNDHTRYIELPCDNFLYMQF